uniref:ubiquitinyl hydrolase 1 n=1 Tax=Meloidogyne incognita TaxID=6306 RepID=A0A914MAT7_MELIC
MTSVPRPLNSCTNYEYVYNLIVEDIEDNSTCGIVNSNGRVGFANIKNSCFTNSVLQSLLHTPVLAELYANGAIKKNINEINNNSTKGILTAWLCGIANCYWSSKYCLINTVEIMNVLSSQLGNQFDGYSPQFAFQFQDILLNKLAEDVNEINYPEYDFTPYLDGPITTWAMDYNARKNRYMRSIIHSMFG